MRALDELDPRLLSNRLPDVDAVLAALRPAARDRLLEPLLSCVADAARPLLERISAGSALGLLGDPRVDAPAQRWGIPEAWFAKSTPRHPVELDAFEIAVHPVTEAEWAFFLADTGVDDTPARWSGGQPPHGRANHPVHGVSWQAILLYTEWLSERAGTAFRVPTEPEWERAARGTDARAYPWGELFAAARCNTREGGIGGTTPIGVYPDGASPCGALDLSRNAEELVADLYRPYPGSEFRNPDYVSTV